MHLYRPTPVQAIDADTKQPIVGADVRISYPLSNASLAPWESRETTGADGTARTRAAPYGRAGIMVEVTAKGYMNEQKFLTVEQVEAFERAGWFEDVNQRRAALVVGLYAAPRPTIELVVPPGYRGIVKARIRIQENGPMEPGQRLFRYEVSAKGEIVITGPPLFKHVVNTDIHFKYADNAQIAAQGKGALAGYWWIKNAESYDYFLVGSLSDNDQFRLSSVGKRMLDPDGLGSLGLEPRGRHRRDAGVSPAGAIGVPPVDLTAPAPWSLPAAGPAPGVPAGLFQRSSGE